ncbi:hypothetical protein [Pantoea sp. ME81]|uniref:hypothetical protein n=1 Tax=Pantoea sp. ME81 TaxID=2743935 RepID=UPI001428A90B|nr:hypothetical protein [Pantoea sp. ME81]
MKNPHKAGFMGSAIQVMMFASPSHSYQFHEAIPDHNGGIRNNVHQHFCHDKSQIDHAL